MSDCLGGKKLRYELNNDSHQPGIRKKIPIRTSDTYMKSALSEDAD